MLDALVGSKNVGKVLIFLFVNGKCYGVQLKSLFKTSLTPIQKALLRLEKGGVITSEYEGKTRLYQFNPSYPLLEELESLLKKAYTQLSPEEKKQYYVIKHDKKSLWLTKEENKRILMEFWNRLNRVKQLSFHAKTKSKDTTGWNGKGTGEISVIKENDTVLIFNEKGSWQSAYGEDIVFSNRFRWTLDLERGLLSLEHLRRGASQPVFLFHLAPLNRHSLATIDSHVCKDDTYYGQFFFEGHHLRLNWRVIGPKKNEEINYYYV